MIILQQTNAEHVKAPVNVELDTGAYEDKELDRAYEDKELDRAYEDKDLDRAYAVK